MNYFYLYPNCIPVVGFMQGTICDLQRNDFIICEKWIAQYFIDNRFINLNLLAEEDFALLKEYMIELDKMEYGFYSENFIPIQSINLTWENKSNITNSILDFDYSSNYNWKKFLTFIFSQGCETIKIRFYYSPKISFIIEVLEFCNNSPLRSIQLLLRFSEAYTSDFINAIADRFPRVLTFSLHGTEMTSFSTMYNNTSIYYLETAILDETYCGIVSPNLFVVNLPFFRESQNHNNCLNKKLSIDKNGMIKLCPSQHESICNVEDVSESIFADHRLKIDTQNISKNQIEVCKDCEYRYICQDCRVYTTTNNLLAKPLKCKYNPYESKWS